MAVLNFPEGIKPVQCDWRLVYRTKAFKNPYNNKVQTLTLPGTYWTANLSFTKLTLEQGRKMHAFVASMNGMAGRVRLHDHAFPNPSHFNRPVVNGAGQTGKRLTVSCSSNFMLPAGSYIQIQQQLVILTADTQVSNGKCTLQFEPALRRSPAHNTAITIETPGALMMFKDDKQGMKRSSKKMVLSSFSLQFVEDIY